MKPRERYELEAAQKQGFLVCRESAQELRGAWFRACAEAKAPMIRFVTKNGTRAYVEFDLIHTEIELNQLQAEMLAAVIADISPKAAFQIHPAFGRTAAMPLALAEQLAMDLVAMFDISVARNFRGDS